MPIFSPINSKWIIMAKMTILFHMFRSNHSNLCTNRIDNLIGRIIKSHINSIAWPQTVFLSSRAVLLFSLNNLSYIFSIHVSHMNDKWPTTKLHDKYGNFVFFYVVVSSVIFSLIGLPQWHISIALHKLHCNPFNGS